MINNIKIVLLVIFFNVTLLANEKVTVGLFYGDTNALMYIAKDKGFFIKNNLEVTLKPYPAGKFAIQDMLYKKLDYAISTEFVPVKISLKRNDLNVIATLGKGTIDEILVRTDSKIDNISNIRNKTIGASFGTVSEYILSDILKHNKIKPKDINIKNIHPLNTADALMTNKVEALVTWEPNITKLQVNYPSRLKKVDIQKNYPYFTTLSTLKDLSENKKLQTRLLLKSLIEAEKWANNNPNKLKIFLKRKFLLKDKYLTNKLKEDVFEVSINQEFQKLVTNQLKWFKSDVKYSDIVDDSILNELIGYK